MPHYAVYHDIENMENLTKFIDATIKLSNNNWIKISTKLTIIYSEYSATQLIQSLYEYVDTSDKIFLSETNLLNWASIGLSDETNDWIYKS